MNIKLIAITKPVIEECKEPNELIAFAARVSNPSNQNNKQTANKLLKYLASHKHWSPFEMGSLVLEIETTRDIAHQILRHRSFSFQEFSQRYAVAIGYELSEARKQDNKNRQNSLETDDDYLQLWWKSSQQQVINLCDKIYKEALEKGIAKELARKVLPEGLTLTKMYMAGSFRSWIHYCQTRCGNDTQKEHRLVALECKKFLLEQIPTLEELFNNESI